MARLPYTNFHDINLDWMIKRVMKAYTPNNPPPYPVKSVNGKTGSVLLTGGDIPFSEDFQQSTVLDFCDYALQSIDDLGAAMLSKQDAPSILGSPGDVLSLDADQNPVWSTPAAGTDDYNDLQNKPQINGVTVSGNKTGTDFGLLNAALARMLYAPIITDTASGDPANFPDGIADMPMEVLANIVPVQDLHGYANPWPAGGGKNILPDKFYNGMAYNSEVGTQITLSENTTVIKTGNIYTTTVNAWQGVGMITNALENGSYKVNLQYSATSTRCSLYTFDEDMKVVSKANSTSDGTWTNTITLTGTEKYIGIYLGSSSAGSITFTEPFIEAGSSFTGFAPYSNICPISGHAGLTLYTSGSDTSNPDVYPVAWGDVAGTVYGGTFNSKTGKLIVNMVSVDLGNYSWSTPISANPNCFTCRALTSDIESRDGAMCSTYRVATGGSASSQINNEPDKTIIVNKGEGGTTGNYPIGTILVKDSDYANVTAEQFQTAMTGVQFVYKIATPLEYDLYTIDNLETLYGDNNVWTDVGPVSVDYYADTKLFILKVI